jgi:hypothetical protein
VDEVKGDIIFDDARVSFIFHVGARTYVKEEQRLYRKPISHSGKTRC